MRQSKRRENNSETTKGEGESEKGWRRKRK